MCFRYNSTLPRLSESAWDVTDVIDCRRALDDATILAQQDVQLHRFSHLPLWDSAPPLEAYRVFLEDERGRGEEAEVRELPELLSQSELTVIKFLLLCADVLLVVYRLTHLYMWVTSLREGTAHDIYCDPAPKPPPKPHVHFHSWHLGTARIPNGGIESPQEPAGPRALPSPALPRRLLLKLWDGLTLTPVVPQLLGSAAVLLACSTLLQARHYLDLGLRHLEPQLTSPTTPGSQGYLNQQASLTNSLLAYHTQLFTSVFNSLRQLQLFYNSGSPRITAITHYKIYIYLISYK